MQYLIVAHDGPGMLEKRMSVRPEHLENMKKVNGTVVCAGGILDENGDLKGSALVIDFANPELVDEYLAAEPYVREKVWEDIRVEPMNVVILNGEFVGK